MSAFKLFVFSPAGFRDPSIAIAASRAGGIGIFDAGYTSEVQLCLAALNQLARQARNPFGISVTRENPAELLAKLPEFVNHGLLWLVIEPEAASASHDACNAFRKSGGQLLIQLSDWDARHNLLLPACDGWIVKGHEAGGEVGEETTFILLQKALADSNLPVYVRGGVGIHTAAACYAVGAAGAVLDNQMLLLTESALKESLRPVIGKLVGNEAVAVGDPLTCAYYRILERPNLTAARDLRKRAASLTADELRAEMVRSSGWEDIRQQIMPIGQDVAFAAPWAERYRNVAGVLRAIRHGLSSHLELAVEHRPLDIDAPLAQSHGTRYPIVQGPMTRVSDTAGFAQAVADQGGLPMLALALFAPDAVRKLLAETDARLGGKPWGIGILGFAPADLLKEQIAVSREFKPAFALIAGGRPEQALEFEEYGIPSYLHVPSPRLLSMFLANGARRFVFEGRECGGHVGPLASFVLWESMVETLLAEAGSAERAGQIHVLFAGGIHDELSAAMVATIAAPLAARGIKVGVLMGSAYLFTHEIVANGSIVPAFQEQALACRKTVCLETGTGHASRCADNDFAKEFLERKAQMLVDGASAEEIREVLEDLNLGRLRLASKGKKRGGPDNQIIEVDIAEQVTDGMYMIGQVAAMPTEVMSIADLHQSVTADAGDYLAARKAKLAEAYLSERPQADPSDIAIIGIGTYLPKAGNVREYWDNIVNRVNGIIEIPSERWDWRIYFDADRHARDKIYSKWGGFVADMVFDPLQYGIPPKSIKAIDPLQLMTLEVLRQTLDDAGYLDRDYDRERTSIILGASGGAGDVGAQYAVRSELPRFSGELAEDVASRLPEWTEDSFAGILLNVAAGRAANRFDFGGLNFTVDAACASSLAAVYQGVVELEDGRSDMVIVGGVDTVQGPFGYLCFSQTQALSPRGQCSTFDKSADGIVISEGIAMLAMKRLADAERDGDRIYAVIKGIGGSSDGRAKSMTAPHPDGQIRALQRAYDKAGYSPISVGLLEAHGTGTVAGDTAELETVTRLMAQHGAVPKQTAIGSVKTLIGHTKASAGVAGLIKSALALYHNVLPPHANVNDPNDRIADPASPLYLNREAQPWITCEGESRRAGVSAFGFGGTNFHITLEEYSDDFLPDRKLAAWHEWPQELFVWSGSDRAALLQNLRRFSAVVREAGEITLRDLAWSLAQQFNPQGECAAIVAGSSDELSKLLDALVTHIEGDSKPLPMSAYFKPDPLAKEGKVAALFAGQGSQYPNMLRQLSIAFPDIPAVLKRANELLAEQLERCIGPNTKLSQLIYPPGIYSPKDERVAAEMLMRTEITQPALGAIEAGLWHLMRRLGLKPDMAAGHSYGEFVALYAAGVFGLDELLQLSAARGRFIKEAGNGDGLGTMAAVTAERAEVEKISENYPDLIVANHNAPQQSILSGSPESIQAVVKELSEKGIQATQLKVGAAFHSQFVAKARDRLAAFIADLPMQQAEFPVYSNTTADVHSDDLDTMRRTLGEHLAAPVEFVAEVNAMYDAGARIFVGLGPKNIQISLIDQILEGRPHQVIRIDDHDGGLKGLLRALGELLTEGVAIDIAELFKDRDCRTIDLTQPTAMSRKQPVPKHAWLLNGSGGRPAGQEPEKPLTLEDIQARNSMAAKPAAKQITDSSKPPSREINMTGNPRKIPVHLPMQTHPEPVQQVMAPAGHELLFAAYQETMRQFLQAQENIMVAYLTGNAPQRTLSAARPAPIAVPMAASMPVVAARRPVAEPVTAPPAPAPVAQAAPPAPAPAVPEPTPAAKPAVSESILDKAGLTKIVLDVVENRTGYPQDMLGLDLNMEADLGIDSIKRVEIVGAVVQTLPKSFINGHENLSESLNRMKTLEGMIQFLASMEHGGEARPFELTGSGEQDDSSAILPRFVPQALPESVDRIPLDTLEPGTWLIVDNVSELGECLASELAKAGVRPVILGEPLLANDADCRAFIRDLRTQHGPVRGVIFLLPATTPGLPAETADLIEWRRQTRRNDLNLYRLLQLTADDLQSDGRVIAVSQLGGCFGRDAVPGDGLTAQGGAVGLLKSINDEWSNVTVKAIDLDATANALDKARALLTEARLPGGRIEVGYPGGTRTIFVTSSAALGDELIDERRQPNSDWVVLATGGARGITAEVLGGLAAERVRLIIVGRTPVPDENNPDTVALKTEAELRRHLVEQARANNVAPKPIEIERQVGSIMRDREIAANLAEFAAAGAKVDYRVADVRDEIQLVELLNDIYTEYGRLDGVIHGAGIIEDKLLIDKDMDSVARVFDTKVDSAFLLGCHLRPDQLRFLIFFTSVAGRYGNTGQTDYATANELVNRLAWQLHREWQGKVKVAAINWGPWEATRHGKGMVTPEAERKFAAMGVSLVPLVAGRQLFMNEILRAPLDQVEVIAGHGPWEAREQDRAQFRIEDLPGGDKRTDSPPLMAGATQATGPRGEIIFRRKISLGHDTYLADHLLDGTPVMPAAVALEVMAEAAALAWPDWIVSEISGFRVLHGVRLEEAYLDLEVIALASSHGDASGFAADLMLRLAGDIRPLYRATVHLANEVAEATDFSSDLNPEPLAIDVKHAYKEWLFHGPKLQTMASFIGLNAAGAVAEIRPSDPGQWLPEVSSDKGWIFDPGIIDSAPQMAIVWVHVQRSHSALPSRFGRVQRFGMDPVGNCRMYFRLHKDQTDHQVKADVAFVDTSNKLRIYIEEMECTSSEALTRLGGGWKDQPRADKQQAAPQARFVS